MKYRKHSLCSSEIYPHPFYSNTAFGSIHSSPFLVFSEILRWNGVIIPVIIRADSSIFVAFDRYALRPFQKSENMRYVIRIIPWNIRKYNIFFIRYGVAVTSSERFQQNLFYFWLSDALLFYKSILCVERFQHILSYNCLSGSVSNP